MQLNQCIEQSIEEIDGSSVPSSSLPPPENFTYSCLEIFLTLLFGKFYADFTVQPMLSYCMGKSHNGLLRFLKLFLMVDVGLYPTRIKIAYDLNSYPLVYFSGCSYEQKLVHVCINFYEHFITHRLGYFLSAFSFVQLRNLELKSWVKFYRSARFVELKDQVQPQASDSEVSLFSCVVYYTNEECPKRLTCWLPSEM